MSKRAQDDAKTIDTQELDQIKPLIGVADAAKLLGLSRSTLDLHIRRSGLPFHELGFPRPGRRKQRCLRFDPLELREWLARRRN